MLFPSSMLPADANQQLNRIAKATITMLLCDDQHKGLTALDFVRGWQRPLKKKLLSAIAPDKPTSVDLVLAVCLLFSGGRTTTRRGCPRTGSLSAAAELPFGAI